MGEMFLYIFTLHTAIDAEDLLVFFFSLSSDLILRSLLLLHLVRHRLDLHILLCLCAVRSVLYGNAIHHRLLTLCERGLKALALGVLAVEAHVVLVQDEVGPVEGLHGQMQGRSVQELLRLVLAVGLGVVVADQTVLVGLARVVTLVTLVVVVHHLSAGFVEQGVLELAQALHDGNFRRLAAQSKRFNSLEAGNRDTEKWLSQKDLRCYFISHFTIIIHLSDT